MNTLNSEPVASLLALLFAESDANPPQRSPALTCLAAVDRDRLMHSKTDYLEFYTRLKDLPLPVSRETGSLLYMLARGCRAQTIVEFGMSLGVSTLHLAAALRDNGGGRIITTEFELGKVARARMNLQHAGLLDLVEIRQGDALQTLATDLPDKIDLMLLDGAKALYADVLDLVDSRLGIGAFIVADNADYCPEYLSRVRASTDFLSTPFAEDVELSMRIR